MTPGFMVYWMEDSGSHLGVSRQQFEFFKPEEMTEALNFMNELRKREDVEFVTFVGQNADSVGKAGVDTIANGMTPDGHKYEWSKQHRAGKTRR
jgi:hypothetical protein